MFIQQKLEGSYKGYVDVIILKENLTSELYIYSDDGKSFVGWTSVNQERPSWTYIINIQTFTNSSNSYVGAYANGKGITPNAITAIAKVIDKIESRYTACTCLGLDDISAGLKDFDGQFWSVVCKANSPYYIYGRVHNLN